MKNLFLFIMMILLPILSIAQGDYIEVTQERFENDILNWMGMEVSQNLTILGPGENEELPVGTVVTFNVTFKQVTVAVFDAWKLTGLFGKISYFERNYTSDRGSIEKYSENFVVSSMVDCVRLFPIKIKSPIYLQKEPMPGYSTGQSTLYLSPLSFECELEIIASGYESIKIQKSSDEFEWVIHLARQVKNINLSGNIGVNNANQNANSNQPNALNVYTTKQIAEMLGLNESDIIALIKSQKLKAKQIGDKYVVRKEDFDAYMKN